jgi:TolA-binding protein
MKIRLTHFLAAVLCLAFSGITSWAQEPGSQQNGVPEQLQDRNMDRAALRLYQNALKYYDEKAHWKAAREFIVLLDYYPAFSQADGVLYHLGESMYQMTMYKSAAKMFRFLLTKYSESGYAAGAFYGLQRISYQTENHPECLKIFSGLVAKFGDSDVIDGARYYAGMSYFNQRDYDNAIATLGKVRARSEYFDHSLYTIGLAHLKKKRSTRLSQHCVSC